MNHWEVAKKNYYRVQDFEFEHYFLDESENVDLADLANLNSTFSFDVSDFFCSHKLLSLHLDWLLLPLKEIIKIIKTNYYPSKKVLNIYFFNLLL